MKKRVKRFLILCGCITVGGYWFFQSFLVSNVYAYDAREVILDAGHGGYDPGASSNGLLEKDMTLEITQMVKEKLEEQGIKVTMTRKDDRALGVDELSDLKERVSIANHTNARYFISIHMNASQTHDSDGMEIYHNQRGSDLAQQVYQTLDNLRYTKGRGTFHDRRLYVLKHTNMAAMLLEVGFIDSYKDRSILNNRSWKQKIAEQIVAGIMKQMGIDDQAMKDETSN